MKKLSFAAVTFLLSFVCVSAQEVFPLVPGTYGSGFDRDHHWTEYYTSNRFVIYYSSTEAPITQQAAQTALNELENIYDVYVNEKNFRAPFVSNPNEKKKMGVYVLRPNEGHAFGGTVAGGPGMWLSAGAVSDKWALAHEFMHGLQQSAGGFTINSRLSGFEGDFVGWFHENHANLMPHQVYPAEMHYCSEMYTRMANLYLGSTRNRYCSWQFFEYLIDKFGVQYVNDLWSRDNRVNDDVLGKLMRIHNVNQKEFGDMFGEFAAKTVNWDLERGARFRQAYSNTAQQFKRPRYTYLEALDSTDGENGRFVSPFATAPQRYGYNIIRLYPDASAEQVRVKFRGDVQERSNIQNYTKTLNLEPNAIPNPGSDWRYALVAVNGTSSRYSDIMRASDGNPDITMQLQNGEELYLVVAAAPTEHHKIKWDQFYYTIYRYPYMVEIQGAKPQGFQPQSNPSGSRHANGGGFVASTANAAVTAFVGPNARVLGTAQVSGNARVEGRAVVQGNARISDNAVVKDYAFVNGGTISGSAVISEGANIWNGQVSGNARVDGAANLHSGGIRLSDNSRIGGVCWVGADAVLSGSAQILGDGEVNAVTASKGVFFGLVSTAEINDNQHGANRTAEPVEVTAPRSMKWYGDDSGPNGAAKTPFNVQGAKRFTLDNRGTLHYSLDGKNASTKLKIFDSRGRVLRSVSLSGTRGKIDMRSGMGSKVMFWKVETNGKTAAQGKISVIR